MDAYIYYKEELTPTMFLLGLQVVEYSATPKRELGMKMLLEMEPDLPDGRKTTLVLRQCPFAQNSDVHAPVFRGSRDKKMFGVLICASEEDTTYARSIRVQLDKMPYHTRRVSQVSIATLDKSELDGDVHFVVVSNEYAARSYDITKLLLRRIKTRPNTRLVVVPFLRNSECPYWKQYEDMAKKHPASFIYEPVVEAPFDDFPWDGVVGPLNAASFKNVMDQVCDNVKNNETKTLIMAGPGGFSSEILKYSESLGMKWSNHMTLD